jgi:hypothetical protein
MDTKNKTINIIKWIFSIIFLLVSIGALTDKAIISFIAFLLIGLLLLPPLTEFWKTKLPFTTNLVYKGLIIFGLIIIAGIGLPKPTKTNMPTSKTEEKIKEEDSKQEQSSNKIEEPKVDAVVYTKKQLDSIAKEKVRAEKLAKEQAEAEQIARDAVDRKGKIEKQFSAWDGSHKNLERYIKENMNDPDSYDHVETRFEDKGKYIFIACKFRGTNAFGGKIVTYVTAKADIDGNLLEVSKF